jgi:serine/threonine protein kinase
MAPDLIGKKLDRYHITHLISESEWGSIFRGEDEKTQKEVVIRVLAESLIGQANFEQQFLINARQMARLDHPGIVKVLNYGKHENHLYLVMEVVTGETLAYRMDEARKKREFLPQLEVIQITRQIALALDYARRQGVLHFELYPATIFLKPAPATGQPFQPVLSDPGPEWAAMGGGFSQQVRKVGFPAYFSPEQARGDQLDIRSDVFVLGVLLYELATMKLPFPVKTIEEAVAYHRKEQPIPPRALRPGLSEDLEAVTQKMLQKDAEKRYQDMASLAQALDRVAIQLERNPPSRPAQTLPPKPASPKGPAVPRPSPAPQRGDYVRVEAPNRPVFSIPITKGEMSIGRGKAADIPLNSLGVSRAHAKLMFENQHYYLIDLDSINGTFLDEGRLLPGVRDLWTPGKTARIGPFSLQLVLAGERPAAAQEDRHISQIFMRNGKEAEPKHIHLSPGEGRVGVVLEEDDLEVEPGESVGMTIVLSNQGETVDHFRVRIEGVPASWVSIQPQAVFLMPYNQGTVQATFKPPKLSTSKAGVYDLTIQVSSAEAPDQAVEVIATLTVLPYTAFYSELHPQKIDTNQKARITIRNQGNQPEIFVVSLKDQADKLKFIPPQAQVQIPEGQPGALEFSAHTRRLQVMRKPVTHAYTAELSVASGGEKRLYNGEIVSHGLIPAWLPLLLVFLCLALAAAAVFGYKMLTQPTPTPTTVPVVPSETPTAPFAVLPLQQETPAPFVTFTPVLSPTPTRFCPGAPEPRVKKGNKARVSSGVKPDTHLKVHQTAEVNDGNVIYLLEIGTEFTIVGGPKCVDSESTGQSVIMWQIQVDKKEIKFNDGSSRGWVVEGESLAYYIERVK